MAACGTPSPPLPPQLPRDLRAAPTLPGLANPPIEGVQLTRLSSVHRVKRSVFPKEPVNTSISDLLHSTANVKLHYPPSLNGVPDPTFTNCHKAWSPWSTVVCRLTPSPLTFGRPRKALSRTASGTKRKSCGTVFSNLLGNEQLGIVIAYSSNKRPGAYLKFQRKRGALIGRRAVNRGGEGTLISFPFNEL